MINIKQLKSLDLKKHSKRIKEYKFTKDSIIINNKYEICLDGTIFYYNEYIGKRGDFPMWIFDLICIMQILSMTSQEKELAFQKYNQEMAEGVWDQNYSFKEWLGDGMNTIE